MAINKLHLYAIGQRGNDLVRKPQDVDEAELLASQNVEVLSGSDGALDQRTGMSKINGGSVLNGSVLMALDVPSPFLTDYTPYLYAGLDSAATHKWRRSSDGVTWANDDTPSKPFSPLASIASFRNWPKAATIGTKMYFVDGNAPIGVHQYDGTTDITLSTIPPSVSGLTLATPNLHALGSGANGMIMGPQGTTGATTYTYKTVAIFGATHSAASAAATIANGNATLNGTNYNVLDNIGNSLPDSPVAGATSYDVYRTAGGASQGKIGSIPIVAGAFTTGNGSGLNSGLSGSSKPCVFSDAGLTGDATTPPVAATGSSSGNAIAVLDLITDGTSLFLAVVDAVPGDPTVNGRILKFSPQVGLWTQIGAAFPTATGNGSPSAIVPYQGALTFGTYIGTATGSSAYLASTGVPLPAGGINAAVTPAVSISPNCLAMFNGTLYVGFAALGATAAILVKYTEAVPAGATSLTAGGSTARNAFTTLLVFNGRLYAGWWSNAAAASVISSTADGVSWTTEQSLNNNEFPGQMVVFGGSLYVVTNATGSGSGRVLKRTTGGVWSVVDTPSDHFAGSLAVVYL